MPKPRTFTILARDLHDLLKPALAMACTDDMLPVICSVLLEGSGSTITATATDRFRVGMVRHELDNDGDPDAPKQTVPKLSALLHQGDLRQALTVLKVGRQSESRRVRVTVRDASTTFETIGGTETSWPWPFATSIRLTHVKGDYPAVRSILRSANTQADDERAGLIGLNFHLLDGFKLASRSRFDCWSVTIPRLESRPIGIAVGDHFVGALMPRRRVDGGRTAVLDGWDDVLPEPAKPAAA